VTAFDIIDSQLACGKKEFAQPGGQGQDEPLQRSSRKSYFDWEALLGSVLRSLFAKLF
jgi:hypothetical protein